MAWEIWKDFSEKSKQKKGMNHQEPGIGQNRKMDVVSWREKT